MIAGWDSFATDDQRGFEFYSVGLPGDIATRPLEGRRKWVKESAPAWTLDTAEPVREWGVWYQVTVCPQESQVDVGVPINLRFSVLSTGPEKRPSLLLGGMFASWRPIDADGRTTGQDLYDQRLQFPHDMGEPKRDQIDLVPGQNGPLDLAVLTSRRPPLPGIYLFDTLHAAPMFMRVRRSVEFEKKIPDLLKPPLNAANVELLGRQRVWAAVGPLTEALKSPDPDRSNSVGFAAAAALGRIGNPASIPVLLDHPRQYVGDMMGYTYGSLKQFGSAAWPEYEKRIISWRGRLTGDSEYGLSLLLGLLGPNGSEAADRARLEIVEAMVAQLKGGREGQQGDAAKFLLLRAAAIAIAPRYPDRVVDTIISLADRPELASWFLRELQQSRLPPEQIERIALDLWARLKLKPAEDRLRTAVLGELSAMIPRVLVAESGPITDEKQAFAAIRAAMAVADKVPRDALRRRREEAVDRVQAWLKSTPTPPKDMSDLRRDLALLCFYAKRYEDCIRLLDVPEGELKDERLKVVACTYRGMALAGLRKFDEAQAELKWAADHAKVSDIYEGLSGGDIRRRYAEVWWMPRRDDVRIRTVFLRDMEATSGDPRQYGRRIFGVDSGFRLKAGDPLSEESRVWATMSQEPRDFAPLDERRVFLALKDRTAVLYAEGRDQPVWKRPFALAPESYLSAGPVVITAAEEDGTLHAIEPATGKTLWTRKVKTSPWTVQSSCNTTLLRQADGVVLVPDKRLTPTQLECVDAATGKSLWTARGIDRLSEVAVGQGLVVLGGPPGHVTALERGTGRPVFEVDLCPELKEKHDRVALALDPAGRHVYAAVRNRVWALDAATGRTLWQWTWQERKAMNPPVRPYRPVPQLYPVDKGLFALFQWSEEDNKEGPSLYHSDVVRFADDGTVALHETSPSERSAFGAFVDGNRLALRKGTGWWEVWEFGRPPIPPSGRETP
ncbi:MAG: PQQ-binding-like beta-propeller repeat protein [Planctomycetota bacterium]|nr:PQQ-binding-like beta-propeller repeat protein [Planctomycetota bacterium]